MSAAGYARLVGGRVGGDGLTDHFNRRGGDPDRSELVRLAAIREKAAAILACEVGGVRGVAGGALGGGDRPGLTQLVQEVWLKLEGGGSWDSREHFLAAAARASRQVLIDEARRRARRGRTVPLDATGPPTPANPTPATPCDEPLSMGEAQLLLAIDRALGELAGEGDEACARAASVARLRIFGGLSCAVIAVSEGFSRRTAERDWRFARAYLASRLEADLRGEGV